MIGIIGGAGPLASALLYQLIIEEYYRKIYQNNLKNRIVDEEKASGFDRSETGPYYNMDLFPIVKLRGCSGMQGGRLRPPPEILLLNHAFTRGLTLQESATNHASLCTQLEECIQLLMKAGAAKICIACNTLHSFLPRQHCLNLIHLPQTVMGSLRRQYIVRTGVLSTETTKQFGLYSDPSISFVYPSEEEQQAVSPILDRILEGSIEQRDAASLRKIVLNMKKRHGIEAVVLGCTDLSVLHRQYPVDTPGVQVFDSIRILAEEILELYFQSDMN